MLWCNGALVDGATVPFDLADRGLLLGDGVFDTALAIDGRIAFEEAHVARLVGAAEALGFSIAPARVVEAMRAVAGASGHVAIRTTVTRGPGPRGIAPPDAPRPLLFARGTPARTEFQFAPLRLTLAGIRRNETSPTSRLKTLGYLDAVLETREAVKQGFDDVLFLNTAGRVACTGSGNILMVSAGRIVAPPIADGALPGIVRSEIFQSAGRVGISMLERGIDLDELRRAEAVLMTNSLRLISPVAALDGCGFASATHPAFAPLVELVRSRVTASCDLDPGSVW